MHWARSILRTTVFFILCLFTWILIRIAGLIETEFPNKNILHVPSNAEFAMRIDGQKLAETTLFSVILESKDEDILQLVQQSIKKRTYGENELRNTGINFLSDVVVFSHPYKNGEISGFIFNLLNSSAFLKNMPEITNKEQVFAASADIGVMLSYRSIKGERLSEGELNSIAERITKTKTQRHHAVFKAGDAPNRYSEMHLHVGHDKDSQKEINLTFEQDKESFVLRGDFHSVSDLQINPLKYALKPKGLHITNNIFAKEWADSLQQLLDFLPAKIPNIGAFSLNYSGAHIVNHSSGYVGIPQMELVIQCTEAFSISDFLNSPDLKNQMDFEVTGNKIKMENENIYFKQLAPDCFYLGIDPRPELIAPDKNSLLYINGSLEPLTTIEGGGFMTAILEMLPIYKASKYLAYTSRGINLSISKRSENKAYIKGSIIFKEGKYPMSEVMRFLLSSQVIK